MIRSFLYAEHLRSVSHVAVLNSPQGGSLRTNVRQGLLKEISDHGVGVFYSTLAFVSHVAVLNSSRGGSLRADVKIERKCSA